MSQLTAREKRAERKGRGGAAMDMPLVSLIDVFTILIFFLLSSAAGVELLNTTKAVKLPDSLAEQAPKESVVLVVAGDEILVDGRRVALVSEVMATPADLIPALKAELDLLAQRKAVKAENQAAQAASGQAVTIMADKDISYALLRKVMVTCAQASFTDVAFAVRKKLDA